MGRAKLAKGAKAKRKHSTSNTRREREWDGSRGRAPHPTKFAAIGRAGMKAGLGHPEWNARPGGRQILQSLIHAGARKGSRKTRCTVKIEAG